MERLQHVAGFPVWKCAVCSGVWVPDGRAVGAIPPADLIGASEAGEVDARAGLCPAGHGILTRAQSFVGDEFYVDRCRTCSGVWFDRGEWEAVAAAGLSAGLFVMWTEPWQRAQRRQRAAAAYEAQLEGELGRELVQQIRSLADALRQHPSRLLALGYLHGRMSGEG
jgi:Zn-finger nucleic acid-binding protein